MPSILHAIPAPIRSALTMAAMAALSACSPREPDPVVLEVHGEGSAIYSVEAASDSMDEAQRALADWASKHPQAKIVGVESFPDHGSLSSVAFAVARAPAQFGGLRAWVVQDLPAAQAGVAAGLRVDSIDADAGEDPAPAAAKWAAGHPCSQVVSAETYYAPSGLSATVQARGIHIWSREAEDCHAAPSPASKASP